MNIFQLTIGPFGNGLEASSSCCSDDEAQINLKLFLTSGNIDQATQALNHVIQTLRKYPMNLKCPMYLNYLMHLLWLFHVVVVKGRNLLDFR